ncbi:flagellar biosynthesis protein FlgB [Aureimonas endophytica]|uniref:Flagellar basal body rod protein FlgB n=1 Tax=Aureimonas endophytica TaxID=2027858 RepID=A0A917EDX6_9HYPH|nr:flagellar basal body rod protein FlgB [Aureimonas endophytica]GGE23803.1 flagellar biosynthesis protein FlgB [Aureimonas endophytica]
MSDIYLFGLSSRRADWLSQRQTVIAENVANVNSPGYTGKDVKGFTEAMEATQLTMAGTNPLHLAASGGRATEVEAQKETAWDITHSGNSVSLEQEMLKAGEVQRDFSLNTSVTKAFQRFYLMSVKG